MDNSDNIHWVSLGAVLREDDSIVDLLDAPVGSSFERARRGNRFVDLDENRLACELLVRTKSRMRCDCISYATEVQRNWIVALIDDIFNQLNIVT